MQSIDNGIIEEMTVGQQNDELLGIDIDSSEQSKDGE